MQSHTTNTITCSTSLGSSRLIVEGLVQQVSDGRHSEEHGEGADTAQCSSPGLWVGHTAQFIMEGVHELRKLHDIGRWEVPNQAAAPLSLHTLHTSQPSSLHPVHPKVPPSPHTYPVLQGSSPVLEDTVQHHTRSIGGVGLVVEQTIHEGTRQVPQVSVGNFLAEDLVKQGVE